MRAVEGARALRGVALMGVCNVTPDSFSDGGRYLAVTEARSRVDELLAEGADLVDIGGESTLGLRRLRPRPGARAAPAGPRRRPLRRGPGGLRDGGHHEPGRRGGLLSLDAGACAVNDVSSPAGPRARPGRRGERGGHDRHARPGHPGAHAGLQQVPGRRLRRRGGRRAARVGSCGRPRDGRRSRSPGRWSWTPASGSRRTPATAWACSPASISSSPPWTFPWPSGRAASRSSPRPTATLRLPPASEPPSRLPSTRHRPGPRS